MLFPHTHLSRAAANSGASESPIFASVFASSLPSSNHHVCQIIHKTRLSSRLQGTSPPKHVYMTHGPCAADTLSSTGSPQFPSSRQSLYSSEEGFIINVRLYDNTFSNACRACLFHDIIPSITKPAHDFESPRPTKSESPLPSSTSLLCCIPSVHSPISFFILSTSLSSRLI